VGNASLTSVDYSVNFWTEGVFSTALGAFGVAGRREIVMAWSNSVNFWTEEVFSTALGAFGVAGRREIVMICSKNN
jgi:hypothetical protein